MDRLSHNHKASFYTKNVHFKYWPSHFIMQISLSFHLENVNFESLNDIHDSKFRVEWNHHVLGWWPHPPVSSLQSVVGCAAVVTAAIPNAIYAASNWRKFCTGGSTACTQRPSMSQTCSIGFKSTLMIPKRCTCSYWKITGMFHHRLFFL